MAGPMYPRNGIGAAPSQGTPSPKLDDLNKTAGIIDTRLKEDTYPDVSDLISRLETDQSRERTDPKDTHVPFLQQDGFTDMSATISQQFDSLVCKSFMGFLPEIRRAWITVDHTLFLWNYEDPNSRPERDDDGEQIIVGVGLVKPAEGVFLEQIQHLLVVATPLEISITGVAVDDAHYKKLILYKTDLAIAADNVSMVQIEGTEEGRIFMVGHNGQLYELAYQSEDGFFSRKIRKLNHSATAMSVFIPTFFPWGKTDTVEKIAIDKARKLLYILRKDYQIELVYLGADGSGFTRISKTKNLSTDAQGKAERAHGRLDDRDFMVINIHPLKTTESTRFQLLAVTSSGHRLYFSCFDRPFEGQQPTNLKLLAVRDPLSTQNHGNYSTEQYPFHTTYYSDGFLLGCKVLNDEVDRLVVTAPNCGAISQSIPKHWVEQCDSTDVKCRTQDIAEVIQKPRNLCFEKDPDLTFNELALQLEYPPKKYSFLNTAGVAHYSTLRPIDILCEALNNTQDFTKAKNLFNYYGGIESAAMCLAIASGHGSVKEQYRNEALKQKATHLFQDQGGRPHVTNTQNVGRRTNNMDPGFPLETPDYSFSFKHDGFATYLARLLRPIWRKKMFAAAISRKSKNRDERLKPQKSKEVGQKQLDYVKGNLLGLNECLTGRLHRFTAAPSPEMHVPQYVDGAAWKNEQESLYRLHQLLKMALEGIHFVQLLLDYKVGDLVKQWEGAKRTAAYNTDFASLITSDDGRNLCKDLMSALVEKQISDQSGVNIVNDKLRQQCPSICRDNDAAYYKGIELLRTATMQHPGPQQDEQVLEAFGIFKDIAENITSDQLSKIFSMFKSMKYYRGCIDLVLIWANAIDPDNEAQNGGQMGMFPDSDPRSGVIRPVLQAREGAYNLVTELIDSLWLEKDSARSTSRGTTSIDNIIKGVLQQIVFAKDDMFHSTVYNWLAEKGKLRLLFEYDNEDLQRYLKSTSEAKPQNAELYAQYLVQHGKHLRAAEVLHELTNYNGLSLEERMRYLLKAQTEAGTASALGQIRNTRDEDLLVTIREAFEIAGIQLELFQKLKELPDTPEDTLAQLNGELMNLTVMYQRFAKPKKLYDMMLLIFGTADWSDSMAPRIQATWADILREAKETVPEGGVYTAFDAQKSKLKELGQRFHTNKNIFPVKYLVDTLEHECFEAAETEGATKAPEGWVVDTMREIGVPFSELFDVLCGLFDAKLPPWSSTKALTFLVNDGCGLLERWLREVKLRTRSVERDPFLPRTVDDAVVRWLATINGNEFPELEKRLHAISEEMHRMV